MKLENLNYFDENFSFENEQEVLNIEKTLYSIIHYNSQYYLNSLLNNDSVFFETIDIAKANSMINDERNIELPLYLKNFLELSHNKSEQKDSITIRLSKVGVKIIGAFFENSILKELNTSQASVRHSVQHSQNSLIAIENLKEGNIIYQLLKESENEVYLSLKLDSIQKNNFNQIILKKENRLINSKSIHLDGQISFSGLSDGFYTVELIGKNISKRFDLKICVD